jgi:hypothetical protein
VLVTFRTKAHADITMFGSVAVDLLRLAGMTGTVPTAILADDIPSVIARLEEGLVHRNAAVPEDASVKVAGGSRDPSKYDPDAEPAVPLGHRALPLLALLRDAAAAGADVMVSTSR